MREATGAPGKCLSTLRGLFSTFDSDMEATERHCHKEASTWGKFGGEPPALSPW